MKADFEALIKAMKNNLAYSEWASSRTIEQQFEELQKEINELKKAIKNNDLNNLKEELGDVLWDLIFIITICEQKGHFDIKEVMTSVLEKMKRRKPFIFEGKKTNLEEESDIWKKVKEKEKNG